MYLSTKNINDIHAIYDCHNTILDQIYNVYIIYYINYDPNVRKKQQAAFVSWCQVQLTRQTLPGTT